MQALLNLVWFNQTQTPVLCAEETVEVLGRREMFMAEGLWHSWLAES